jgi:hypothetical protein
MPEYARRVDPIEIGLCLFFFVLLPAVELFAWRSGRLWHDSPAQDAGEL